jgi:uncharacterized repeat protein (TIGR03806 family)
MAARSAGIASPDIGRFSCELFSELRSRGLMRDHFSPYRGRLGLSFSSLVLAAVLGTFWPPHEPSAVGADPSVPEGSKARRTPWTSSRFAGTPEPPPPYIIETAFPKLVFDRPLLFEAEPGTNRLFVGEVNGRVYSFPNDPKCERADLALDLVEGPDGPRGRIMLYGMAFHPNYARNRFIFLTYVYKLGPNSTLADEGTRVSRFEVSRTDPPRIDSASEKVVLTYPSGGHNGGCLAFGPDGYLYIATGDATDPSPPDGLDTGQDLSDLLASILRIDVDHEDAGLAYRIPPDNPFVKLEGARTEIWAFGFRNPWKMSFDRKSGDLWAGDVGWELWELVFKIERGGNYGWSIMEGRQPVHPAGRRGPGPIQPPIVDHPHSEAASVTGGYVYHGTRLPQLAGAYIYGDYQTGKVWALRYDGKRVTEHREIARTPLHLVAFGVDHAGELYLVEYERTNQIHKLVPNPAAGARSDFPRTLSRTGLFTSTRDLQPAPGVIPIAIHAEMWSDGARVEQRLLAIPGSGTLKAHDKGYWKLPEGSVLARTVGFPTDETAPSRRIETQVLHFEAGTWRPYSYAWNEDQTDAQLVEPTGSTRTLTVHDASVPSGRRSQTYRFHSQAECFRCHNSWIDSKDTFFGQTAPPLAFTIDQLNRDVPSGVGLGPGNQLQNFQDAGLLDRPLKPSVSKLPRLANPYDNHADLNLRARSYLQVNCAHCHIWQGGGGTTIILSSLAEPAEMKAIDVRPTQGTFEITGAKIITPGDPEGSVLYYRIAKLGGGRMPRLGSDDVDPQGVRLIGDWIAQLSTPTSSKAPAEEDKALAILKEHASVDAIRQLLGSTRGALTLVRLIDRGEVSGPQLSAVVAVAKEHPQGEIRDLFERFVPPSERVRRLGDVVNQAELLNLPGDATRGRQVFFAETTRCKACHRIGKEGGDVGPDLSKIGEKYVVKAALLQHLLEPSQVIDPQYTAYLLETKSGQLYNGLLVKRDEKEAVLKDAQGKLIRVPASDVDQLAPQLRSLMPDLLMKDLTAQQASDLLEFLASQK